MILKTGEIIEEYNNYLVTSYGKPFSDIVFVDGEDVYLKDVEGKRYLDFWAGVTVVGIGHRNPKVQEAVKNQMGRLVHCASQSYYTLPPIDLAKRLSNISPIKPCKITFHTSGTEANELALKMIKRYTGRHEIMALQGSYHAWGYHSAIPGTPTSYYSHDAPNLGPSIPGIYYVPTPYCYRCPLGLNFPSCDLQCAKVIENIINFSTSRNIAGFIAEVIQGVGGIITPPSKYFIEVKKILDKYNIPLILDEVQTRLGQTGKIWGAETYDVKPAVITTAKALANGWPISAVIAGKEIAESLRVGDHYSTFGHNPVMCAAASATIDYIVEYQLWKNAEYMGRLLQKGLKDIQDTCNIIGEIRGKGLMIGVEIVKNVKTKEPSVEYTDSIREFCAKNGLIIGKGGWWNNVLRIQPPMTIREEHVDEAISIIQEGIKHVTQ